MEQVLKTLTKFPVPLLPITQIQPAPENDSLYKPIDPNSQDIQDLAMSIIDNGLKEPLIITVDGFIISGHRRFAAAKEAGLESVPCRVEPISRTDPEFLPLLRECNRQRVKSFDEILREEIVSTNPEQAYHSLIEHRKERSEKDFDGFIIEGQKVRAKISKAKKPLLDAVLNVIEKLRKERCLPTSDRTIHYGLLNIKPLIHASKPDSVYGQDDRSYDATTDIVTRARLEGIISMDDIADETRPVTIYRHYDNSQRFIQDELNGILKGYWRNLMQSQPNHIEIVGEKNTLSAVVKPIAGKYCIPMTLGRGFCSLPPRAGIVKRFKASGKEKLILVILSDHDADGAEIAQSFARSIRDDFGIENVVAIKAGLTAEQVIKYKLKYGLPAKKTSVNYKKFKAKYGDTCFELEALDPEFLRKELTAVIDSVIDTEAFNEELNRERSDAAKLDGARRAVNRTLSGLNLENCDSRE